MEWPVLSVFVLSIACAILAVGTSVFLRSAIWSQRVTASLLFMGLGLALSVLISDPFDATSVPRWTFEWLGNHLQPRNFKLEWLLSEIRFQILLVALLPLALISIRKADWDGRRGAVGPALLLMAAAITWFSISGSGWNGAFVLLALLLSQVLWLSHEATENQSAANDVLRLAKEQGAGMIFYAIGLVLLSGTGIDVGWQLSMISTSPSLELDAGLAFSLLGLLIIAKTPLVSSWNLRREREGGFLGSLLIVGFTSLLSALLFMELIPLIARAGWQQILLKALLSLSAVGLVFSLLQQSLTRSFDLWWSSMSLVAWSMALVLSPAHGILVLVSTFLGGSSIALVWSDRTQTQNEVVNPRKWRAAVVMFGALVGAGFFGSSAGAGIVLWLGYALDHSAIWLPVFFVVGLSIWALMRICWQMISSMDNRSFRWPDLVGAAFLSVIALAPVWIGSVMYPEFDGLGKRIVPGLMEVERMISLRNSSSVVLVFLITQAVFVALSYWLRGRWASVFGKTHRLNHVIERKAHIEGLLSDAMSAIILPLTWFEVRLLQGLVRVKALNFLRIAFLGFARWVGELDEAWASQTHRQTLRLVNVPAKLIQLSQNGDIQWYVFLALFWTLFLLIHFLRF